MRRLETVGEVSARFARIEPGFPASYFRRQVQHYVQLGLVRPPLYQGQGRTSAALFAEREVCAAYLLSALTRLGLKAEQLKAVARHMSTVEVFQWDAGKYNSGFRDVIDDTKTGTKRWFLIVKVNDWARDSGTDNHPVHGEFREQADVTYDPESWLAIVMLDCERLLRPLLDDMDKHEEPP